MSKMIETLKRKIQEELTENEKELKISLPKEIKKALELGDLSENAEYKAALERQEYLKARIGQQRKRLEELAMLNVDRFPKDRIAFGSRLKAFDLDKEVEQEFTLVMPEEADLKAGRISISSPLGKGFIGKKEEDEVVVQTPGGVRRFEILNLTTIHELDD